MINIQFDFRQTQDIKDLQQLNRLLQTMELEELDITDIEPYLSVISNRKGRMLCCYCGFASGTLQCKRAKNRPGHHYQINTFVADRDTDHDKNLERWRAWHPDRTMRISIVNSYKTAYTYIIIHHEKVVNDCDV